MTEAELVTRESRIVYITEWASRPQPTRTG